jgi:aspartyl-tRNA(Asn)/glutamyl-tRNA(Gln) amidotransferase subunit C
MSEIIDEVQVRKVAKLSRLDLTDSEIKEFTGQLETILEYVDKMNQLDTEGVEPLAHCLPLSNCLREDRAGDSLGADVTLANAPQRDGDYFKVPKILDDNSGA